MTNQPLLDFILTEIKQGATKESITKDLIGAGWDPADVQEGFKAAGIADTTPLATPSVKPEPYFVEQPKPVENTLNTTINTTNPNTTVNPTPTFSSLESYANPTPGNNVYAGGAVYTGQQVLQAQEPVNKTFKKVLLFLIIFIIVVAGGMFYFMKSSNSDITKLFTKVSSVFNKRQEVVDVAKVDTSVPVATNQQPPVDVTPPSEEPPEVLPTADIQPLCEDIVCKTYFDVWRKEQMYQNNISAAYINRHFTPVSTQIDKWNSGQSFDIIYDVKIGWAKVRTSDGFMIKTKAGEKTYPALNVRRGIYFSEQEVRAVVNELAFNSNFTWFTPAERLLYPTRKVAEDTLQKAYPNLKLKFQDDIAFDKTNNDSGIANPKAKREMFLVGVDSSNCSTSNMMKKVKLNLFTGVTSAYDDACIIN